MLSVFMKPRGLFQLCVRTIGMLPHIMFRKFGLNIDDDNCNGFKLFLNDFSLFSNDAHMFSLAQDG